jgi:hypothetical protein
MPAPRWIADHRKARSGCRRPAPARPSGWRISRAREGVFHKRIGIDQLGQIHEQRAGDVSCGKFLLRIAARVGQVTARIDDA